MKKELRLSLVTAISIASLGGTFGGCADLVVEVQQTQRVHTSAARNPIAIDSESQGSTRSQSKSPISTGVVIDAKATVQEKTSTGSLFGSDVTGPEK